MVMSSRSIKAFNYLTPAHSLTRLKALCFFSLTPRHLTSLWFCQSHPYSSSGASTSMEVIKAVAGHGSAASGSIALGADQKSYSYSQLILSAQNISNILLSGDLKSNFDRSKHVSSLTGSVEETPYVDGPRVGIVAKPSAEFVAGMLGTWLSGGVAVPLALSYPETELLHVMNDADVSIILSTEEHHEFMQTVASKGSAQVSVLPSVPSITSLTSGSEQSDENRSLQGFDVPYEVQGKEAALILYTSGTTGKPKGVVHTHSSILAQVQMLTTAWGYTPSDRFLHCLPLHHVHGIFNALLAPLYAGSSVEFIPKFSVSGIWKRWRESYPKDKTKVAHAVTVFTGVPTMYTRLIQGYEAMDPELQAESAYAGSQLRLMMSGSSALPYPVMQQWEAITGHRLLERYGMTEFVMAISNPLEGLRKGGTVGKPFPGVEVKILEEDESGGSETTGAGELCVRSPSLFREYWKRPEVTKESFIDGGFFKTGDAVTVDEDGYYVILGRTSADIMKVGGYKLSALEIEAALLEHPVVSECCVLGLPDKAYGEAICTIIVPDAEVKKKKQDEMQPVLTLEELRTWAKEKLAPYKLPTQLYLWDSLPRNAMGKVNKKELKKSLASD